MFFGMNQCTLSREVCISGIGLHSGATVSVVIKPAPASSGICFRRTDLLAKPMIPARFDYVVDTSLATVVGVGSARVATIEHLMAALSAAGVDNALIDVNGPEIPALDGSAAPFLESIRRVGLKSLRTPRNVMQIASEVTVRDGDSFIRACPAHRTNILYTIDFPHPLVGSQTLSFSPGNQAFQQDIAGARTFGFLSDVKRLQNNGLALGGTLKNALVFDETGVLNADGLRFSDECVRHKILDLVGDMSLMACSLVGRFEAYKAGHALHNRLLHKIAGMARLGPCLMPASVAPAAVSRMPYEPVFSKTNVVNL